MAMDISGFEYDWIATDAVGHVAIFSTAGAGFVPSKFLDNVEAHDAAIDAIMDSPIRCQASFFPDIAPGLVNTWRDAAMRGLFAFDSDPNGGPYRLVAAPLLPIHVRDLPASVVGTVERMKLDDIFFEKFEGEFNCRS